MLQKVELLCTSATAFATYDNLICCKTDLNVGGKTRNIAIQLVLQECCIASCTFSLKVNGDLRPRPHLGCDNITSTQGRCCVQRF